MIPKDLVDKINYLANKAKSEGLTDDEKIMQLKLRDEYLTIFKEGFKRQLEGIKIVNKN
jgi:uncharacterized protein YnzC (UPF0291/DUF896 family)